MLQSVVGQLTSGGIGSCRFGNPGRRCNIVCEGGGVGVRLVAYCSEVISRVTPGRHAGSAATWLDLRPPLGWLTLKCVLALGVQLGR